MTIPSIISRLEAGETGLMVDKAALIATCTRFAYHFEYPDGSRVEKESVSTSLDACRALHEGVLPGWAWLVRSPDLETEDQGGYFANIHPFENSPNMGDEHWIGYAPTPAAAYLIAILKAVHQRNIEKEDAA